MLQSISIVFSKQISKYSIYKIVGKALTDNGYILENGFGRVVKCTWNYSILFIFFEGVTANSLHPGIIRIDLGTTRPCVEILLSPLSLFMKTVQSGSQTIVALAVDPDLEKINGKYFVDCEIADESVQAKDDSMAEWLWEVSEIITGLKELDDTSTESQYSGN